MGFSGGSAGKESACNAGDVGLIPGLGRSPRGGHGNPLQYSCLENPKDKGAWRAMVRGVAKNWTRRKQLSMHAHTQLPRVPWRRTSSLNEAGKDAPLPRNCLLSGSHLVILDSQLTFLIKPFLIP